MENPTPIPELENTLLNARDIGVKISVYAAADPEL
jgi:hypothetical protein